MKLWVEPESISVVNSWSPTRIRICIVSSVRMPVIAEREINGASGSYGGWSVGAATVAAGVAAASSGSSTI